MAASKNPTSLPACVSCKREVGAEAGRLPFFVDTCSSDAGAKAKQECFCPQCFVYMRAPKEPLRFRQGAFLAVHCAKCGKESVSIGSATCGQCGSRATFILPPTVDAA